MSYSVAGLSAYTQENKDQLVIASMFDAKTQSLISKEGNVYTNVASAIQVNLHATDAVFQTGGTCGFNASGTTTISNRTLTVGAVKVHESLCPKTLKAKWTQLKMAAGSQPTSIPFEEEYSFEKAGKIAEANETGIWQGDTNSGTANLNKYDGYIKIIDATGSATASNAKLGTGTITTTNGSTTMSGTSTLFTTEVGVNDKIYSTLSSVSVLIGTVASITNATTIVMAAAAATGSTVVTGGTYRIVPAASKSYASPVLASTGVTSSNVRGIVTNVWQSFPARVKGKKDARIFCGWSFYETYIAALIEANLFAYTAQNSDQEAGEITIPGTQYKLTAVHGLDDTNRLFGIRVSNMHMGCEINGEDEKFEIFHAKEADEVRFMNEFKLGVQVGLPAEIVQFTLA